MHNLTGMIWVETRKAMRSRMPLWTVLASLFMPFGVAFLIFVAKHPELSQKLSLVSAKADLIAFSAAGWPTYLGIFSQLLAAGGFLFFVLIVSWIFGREFADGTVKDLLAVPVQRSIILLAKFAVAAIWSSVLAIGIMVVGIIFGAIIGLPEGSRSVMVQGCAIMLVTVGLAILVALPFAFFASAGRGYLLPVGVAVLTMMATNLVAIAGWGAYFPWGVPGLYAQGKIPLTSTSYWIVLLTGMAGISATYFWWKSADQSH
jgi:ABC-2 type transport system permease protein